jgi:hypothetical protein
MARRPLSPATHRPDPPLLPPRRAPPTTSPTPRPGPPAPAHQGSTGDRAGARRTAPMSPRFTSCHGLPQPATLRCASQQLGSRRTESGE